MILNHIRITNAKPRDNTYKVADSDGLYLVVQTNGAKLWCMNYRHLGRQKTLYFGAWPEVGIAMSREQIAAGLDPAAEKRIETLARKVAADNMFKAIAEEWVAKNDREGRAPITLDKIRWLIGSRRCDHRCTKIVPLLRAIDSYTGQAVTRTALPVAAKSIYRRTTSEFDGKPPVIIAAISAES